MEARLPFTGDPKGSESRMSHADPATSTPATRVTATPQSDDAPSAAAVQAQGLTQGNLWNDFLRRNLLLAGLAGAGALRRADAQDGGATDAR